MSHRECETIIMDFIYINAISRHEMAVPFAAIYKYMQTQRNDRQFNFTYFIPISTIIFVIKRLLDTGELSLQCQWLSYFQGIASTQEVRSRG